jgi:hypothetical protein
MLPYLAVDLAAFPEKLLLAIRESGKGLTFHSNNAGSTQ